MINNKNCCPTLFAVKSNTVLAPQYLPENQLATERAFLSKSNSTIKEGFSSDEEEEHFETTQKTDFSEPSQGLLEDIYMASYGSRGSSFAVEGKSSGKQRSGMLEQAVAGSSRALAPNFTHSSQGPSQVDQSGGLFPSTNERLSSMTNRDFNRTALWAGVTR